MKKWHDHSLYDTTVKTIPNMEIIMPINPLWPLTLYLTHQKITTWKIVYNNDFNIWGNYDQKKRNIWMNGTSM
jgi:hypothetical protein